MKSFDVILLGAGAAGLMAAIEAGRRGHSVLVLEKAAKPAEKIRISGGGRCNFTNLHCAPANFLSQNPRFCVSALKRYTQRDVIARVEAAGIAWHEKTLGQLFCDGSSQQIIDMLLDEESTSLAELEEHHARGVAHGRRNPLAQPRAQRRPLADEGLVRHLDIPVTGGQQPHGGELVSDGGNLRTFVDVELIQNIVAKIARIPPKNVSASDRDVLRNIERDLKLVIFGQDRAIGALAAAADPADDPLEPCSRSHGFRVRPPYQTSPIASAPSVSLATSTAPASSSRRTTVAFSAITCSSYGFAPQVVR